MLFSQKGFFGTSISDIVRESGLPVGTIYTYFESKEAIVRTIVEEGWADLYGRLQAALSQARSPEEAFQALLDRFVPEVLGDLDLINILLAEAIDYTRIEEKLEKLVDLLYPLLKSIPRVEQALQGLSRRTLTSALAIYFLGILNAAKISRSRNIGLKLSDITGFLKLQLAGLMGVKVGGQP
jgi:AcrR family transcriptional regulator